MSTNMNQMLVLSGSIQHDTAVLIVSLPSKIVTFSFLI